VNGLYDLLCKFSRNEIKKKYFEYWFIQWSVSTSNVILVIKIDRIWWEVRDTVRTCSNKIHMSYLHFKSMLGRSCTGSRNICSYKLCGGRRITVLRSVKRHKWVLNPWQIWWRDLWFTFHCQQQL
jgi:hypothetical protein